MKSTTSLFSAFLLSGSLALSGCGEKPEDNKNYNSTNNEVSTKVANIINTDEAKKIADVKVENIKSKMTALIDEIDKSAGDPSVDGMFTFEGKTFDLYYQYYNDEFFDLITKNKANIVAELKKPVFNLQVQFIKK